MADDDETPAPMQKLDVSRASANHASVKRKRDESTAASHHEPPSEERHGAQKSPSLSQKRNRDLVNDLIDVLTTHDPTPPILSRPLGDRSPSTEPQAKRSKAASPSAPSTILSRHAAHAYDSVDDVLRDIDSLVAEATATSHHDRDPSLNGSHQSGPRDLTFSRAHMAAWAFQKRAHELSRRERDMFSHGSSKMEVDTQKLSPGGHGEAKDIIINPGEGRTMLTVLGDGQRQLFSSLQKPIHVEGQQIVAPLRELGLPPNVFTSRLLPTDSLSEAPSKTRQTLGDAFPIPSSIAQMQPPKPSKFATTRSLTVGWYQADDGETTSKYGIYPSQNIQAGQWLDYSCSAAAVPNKKRDRALSLTGKLSMINMGPSESEAEKLDSLFRSAYSGFAPSRDDAGAMVPQSQLSRLWWQRSGGRIYNGMIRSCVDDRAATPTNPTVPAEEFEEFAEAVQDWDPSAIDPEILGSPDTSKDVADKDVDELLDSISELLETLDSYQRNRHVSLAPARASSAITAVDLPFMGTPSKPGDAEQATYEILKAQLSILIATLPPHAVAKLDSTRLGDLRISTKIPVLLDDHKGLMDEDDLSARAKAAAASAASNSAARATPSASQHRGSTTSLYGNQYSTSRNPSLSHQFSAPSQTSMRNSTPSAQRPQTSLSAQYAQRPPTTTYRPNGYATPSYPQTAGRPTQPYTHGPPGGAGYATASPATAYAPRVPYQIYQQQTQSAVPRYSASFSQPGKSTQAAPQSYGYGGAAGYPSQPSPSPKPVLSPGMTVPQPPGSARASYSQATPAAMAQDLRPPYVQQPRPNSLNTVTNGGRPSASPVSASPLAGMPGWSTHLDSRQQAEIMDKQRLQLAQQQQQGHPLHAASQAAENAGMPPQPAHLNGIAAGPGS